MCVIRFVDRLKAKAANSHKIREHERSNGFSECASEPASECVTSDKERARMRTRAIALKIMIVNAFNIMIIVVVDDVVDGVVVGVVVAVIARKSCRLADLFHSNYVMNCVNCVVFFNRIVKLTRLFGGMEISIR